MKNSCYFCDICGRLEGLPCLINFKYFLLLNLLFSLFLRYLLACVFTLHEKFLFRYFCDFCVICGHLAGLLCLINFKSFFLLLNLLFLRYMLVCVFTLHEKFLLHTYLRTSRGPSLPYKLQVFSFAKFVILVNLAIFASQFRGCQNFLLITFC